MRDVSRHVMVFTMAAVAAAAVPADTRAVLAERVVKLTRDSFWKPVASVPIKFTTYHPQGMVKIGETLFVSSVEIQVRTKRLVEPLDRYDRDTGRASVTCSRSI